jgi:phospholipid/cholesterol/gamma-HCH transport system substrate-binding protein
MKFPKEARIGLLVSIAVLIFFAGFYYLKGSNIFSGENTYYADYNSVQGLSTSAAVQIKGVNVGKVSDIHLEGGKVRVSIAINKKTQIPSGTSAELISLDLLGSKAIRLDLSNNPEVAKDREVLPATVETGIIDNISSEISPLVEDVRKVVGVLNSVLSSVNDVLNKQTKANITNSMVEINATTKNFTHLSGNLDRETQQLEVILNDAHSIINNLKENNESVNKILDNASSASDQLAQAPIEKTVNELHETAAQLNSVMTKINNGEGSIGMAVNDKNLYHEMDSTLHTLNILMADIQKHPTRYINVTIFGKKKKEK